MDDLQNGKTNIQYLLGELTPEEQRQIDEQLFISDDYFERLLVTEDELIDDYLRDRLSESEREQFERNFLTSADLRKKVDLMKLLLSYIDGGALPTSQASVSQTITGSSYAWPIKFQHPLEFRQDLRQGLSVYRSCLWITSVFRLALLTFFCLLLYLFALTSSVASPVVFSLFIFLTAIYVPLEALSARRSLMVAKFAIADTHSEE